MRAACGGIGSLLLYYSADSRVLLNSSHRGFPPVGTTPWRLIVLVSGISEPANAALSVILREVIPKAKRDTNSDKGKIVA